jgi:CBS domain-containing protein
MLKKVSIAEASTHSLIKAWPDDTLGDILLKLTKHNSVVVIDTSGHLQGVISRKDAVEAIIDRPDWKDIPVSELMRRDVLYIPNHVSILEAARTMLKSNIHQLVVVGPPEGGSVPIGILTLQDILANVV